MRTIGVVTTSRADYNLTLPLVRAMLNSPGSRPQLLVAGAHLSPEFGSTVDQIEADGLPIAARIEMLLGADTPAAIAKSMGLGVIGFAQAFAAMRPDILVVQGDRFEMHAAALAALPFKLPVAHLGGGDITEGAMDESLRHSMTKLSHLHFVALEEQAERLRRMGEEPWRIFVTGEAALDLLHSTSRLSAAAMESRYEFQFRRPFLLVAYHPVTLEFEDTERQIQELLAALDEMGLPVLFTAPNADTRRHVIRERMQGYLTAHPDARLVDNLGPAAYYSAMSMAAALVGNSSSGILEAASFQLPVVNAGNRQQGRRCSENVISTGCTRAEIKAAILKATSPEFRQSLENVKNLYGDGSAIPRILRQLESVPLDGKLLRKKFFQS
jgi:UDP-hydrolysing UDP-N-acetyl-D-glucosamine 2-epimerase